jgi:hypothetical protein
VPDQNRLHALVPVEITQCEVHAHEGQPYVSKKALAMFLGLGRFSVSADREGLLVLDENFLNRLRDPRFKSPCNPECFPFKVFLHVYVTRFPYRFPLNGLCCSTDSGVTSICSRDKLIRRTSTILEQRAGENGLAYEQAVSEVQRTCSDCVLSNREVAVATINASVARDPRFSREGDRILFTRITEFKQLPLSAQRTKRRISSFPGPVSALE